METTAVKSGGELRLAETTPVQPTRGLAADTLFGTKVEGDIYLTYLGLSHNPFPVVPDARHFYREPRAESSVTELLHAILGRKGFMLLTGEVGLGKSTITRRLLLALQEREIASSLILNSFTQGVELLRAINKDFGIDIGNADFQSQLDALNSFLLEQFWQGNNCVLVIDDAQNLSIESLELVRMLSNLETEREKLLQILLVGQPELEQNLQRTDLRQLMSRVALHARVLPWDRETTEQYIYFKLNTAGCNGCISMQPGALRAIQRFSNGNPRRLNLLMERCLYGLCAHRSRAISPSLVWEAETELIPATAGRRHWWFLGGAAAALTAGAVISLLLYNSGMLPSSVASSTVATPPPLATAAPSATPTLSDEAIQTFLAAYQLEEQTRLLAPLLRQNKFGRIQALLANLNTLQPVTLAQQEDASDEAPLLQLPSGKWLLLWQAPYRLEAYHYGVNGEAVELLQQDLASLGYYDGTLDGVVGGKLMKAIYEFQRDNQLSPTGNPDSNTLYRIQHRIKQTLAAKAAKEPEDGRTGG
ncbi:ExeA family protein [Candidatus Endoriftia persephone]|jgi:general secretion pathway protein A|uniref:General secretion pathway protein A n=3 Tax=Gammaproteobacteria TaxID=1236 RepID=G2FIU2_9GAMM|nr:ExeA family protein [Candidatus Endoriftia persephone]EGV51414.1 general secretion pathway protein A [endosymbiont of Riftia pachyptila (vent Ph05)]EGW53277.1 general secretion pathway protein A [endosymbiont of Tevnia jerichonana (vent Tica)]USF87801.1 AAA family ATPase [Candidatus Endoriftia persephone]